MTAYCIKNAASLLASIDRNVNPCDDFYEFSCGNWIKTHPIPDDRATVSNFEEPTIALQYTLKSELYTRRRPWKSIGAKLKYCVLLCSEMLEEKTTSKYSSVEIAKQLYQACENDTLMQTTWRTVFNEALENMNGWPILKQNWKQSPYMSLSRLYGYLTLNYSQDSLFKFTIGADDKNSSNYVFQASF